MESQTMGTTKRRHYSSAVTLFLLGLQLGIHEKMCTTVHTGGDSQELAGGCGCGHRYRDSNSQNSLEANFSLVFSWSDPRPQRNFVTDRDSTRK